MGLEALDLFCGSCRELVACLEEDAEVCPFCGNPVTDFGSYIDLISEEASGNTNDLPR